MKQKRNMHSLFLILLLFGATLHALSQDRGATKLLPASRGGTLDVSISNGDIRISSWEKNEVQVRTNGITGEDIDHLSVTQEGKTIRVRLHSNWESEFHLDVTVPAQFNLDIETSNGNIDIDGPLSGKLRGSTSGGDIRLGNLAGQIDMTTSGGNISSGNTQGDLRVKTSGGDLHIGNVSGEAEVGTSGGEISLEKVGKRLRASTAGGGIRIGDVGGDASVSTAGGDIEVGKVSGNASLSTAGGNIELLGATGTVHATTAGGDLLLQNITGSVDGRTEGGAIDVKLVPGKNGKSKLVASAGDIRLSVPDNAKATIKARIRVRGWWNKSGEDFDIRSDFKTEEYVRDDEHGEVRASVNLNGGGETISLETTMGNIEIRRTK